MLPRPLQESNVVNKGGTAGFLGKAYDPYYRSIPEGDDMNMSKLDRIIFGWTICNCVQMYSQRTTTAPS